MLDGYIQVVAHLFLCPDGLYKLICDFLRIAVLNANPVDTRNLCQLPQKSRKTFLPVKVPAVGAP